MNTFNSVICVICILWLCIILASLNADKLGEWVTYLKIPALLISGATIALFWERYFRSKKHP